LHKFQLSWKNELKGDEEMKKFKYYLALVALCLGLVGCGNNANVPYDNNNGNANGNTNDSMTDNGTNGNTGNGNTGNMYTRDMAEESALGIIDGRVANYTERFDDDEPHHLFEIVNDNDERYEVRVHRDTGEVIDHRRMTDND
jgi:hypothetical protein